jgi:hypothetical protein
MDKESAMTLLKSISNKKISCSRLDTLTCRLCRKNVKVAKGLIYFTQLLSSYNSPFLMSWIVYVYVAFAVHCSRLSAGFDQCGWNHYYLRMGVLCPRSRFVGWPNFFTVGHQASRGLLGLFFLMVEVWYQQSVVWDHEYWTPIEWGRKKSVLASKQKHNWKTTTTSTSSSIHSGWSRTPWNSYESTHQQTVDERSVLASHLAKSCPSATLVGCGDHVSSSCPQTPEFDLPVLNSNGFAFDSSRRRVLRFAASLVGHLAVCPRRLRLC